jgi:excisionase family DNA binding protein
VAPGTAPRVRTTPTTEDLVSYWGGRYRLLRVREVAEQLGVSSATAYGLCERGELPYVWIVTSMRIRPDDLEEFIRSKLTVPVSGRLHRRKPAAE